MAVVMVSRERALSFSGCNFRTGGLRNTLITATRGCDWLSQGKSAHLCKLLPGYSQKFRDINVRVPLDSL
jgi:hypothetical protein